MKILLFSDPKIGNRQNHEVITALINHILKVHFYRQFIFLLYLFIFCIHWFVESAFVMPVACLIFPLKYPPFNVLDVPQSISFFLSRRIATSPNPNAEPNPHPNPDRGATFLGDNCSDIIFFME